MTVFSELDIKLAAERGITSASLDEQWNRLQNGFPFIDLVSAATPGKGILELSEKDQNRLIHFFDDKGNDYEILKFVPASGAATRMFKAVRDLYQIPLSSDAENIIKQLEGFPFYPELKILMATEGLSNQDLKNNPKLIADFILKADGLGYNNAPKGLIPFDLLKGQPTTAFEEQLYEAEELSNGNVHFTVSEQAIFKVKNLLGEKDSINYSIQESATDYIARNSDEPLRNENGELLFRPSGHGALLKNLNKLSADIVFIKNIDNILPPAKNQESVRLKKAMGGLLIELKQQINTFLIQLDHDPNVDLIEISNWIRTNLNPFFESNDKDVLHQQLNKPLRVAGMVKNEGKAGGGPFWVKDKTGTSLQIVEGAQIDMSDSEQLKILNSSTHFNPVDLVCALNDYKGQKFDLEKYIDKDTGFDSGKNVDGKDITIIERPGLWNGAMSGWNTVFVEVSVSTFNPVKSVTDLLER